MTQVSNKTWNYNVSLNIAGALACSTPYDKKADSGRTIKKSGHVLFDQRYDACYFPKDHTGENIVSD